MVLMSAACTSIVDGAPTKAAGAAPQSAIDIDQLDVGPYPTKPRPPLGVAGDPTQGVLLEAQRMANHVIGPWEADQSLTGSFGFGALALPTVSDVTLIGPAEIAGVAGRHHFVNGFASARTEENKKVLVNAVLRFKDDADAVAAATEMGEISVKQQGLDGPARKAAIPGHPETQASTYTATDPQIGKFNAVRSFTAHGRYVLMQLAQSTDSVDAAIQLVAKSIDLQGPEIDRFRATDVAEFADITVDPDGLLARTIPVDEQDATVTQNATYEARGALHFQSDPVRSAKLFSDSGTDLVAMAKTTVYEAADAGGAARIVEGFLAELQPISQPASAVPNLPGTRCLRFEDGGFYCLATAEEYAIEAGGSNLLDAQQLAAAQYVMLVSN